MKTIKEILNDTKTIAVIGMKSDEFEEAYKIPFYMKEHGYIIFAVNPTKAGKEIWDSVFYGKAIRYKGKYQYGKYFQET